MFSVEVYTIFYGLKLLTHNAHNGSIRPVKAEDQYFLVGGIVSNFMGTNLTTALSLFNNNYLVKFQLKLPHISR